MKKILPLLLILGGCPSMCPKDPQGPSTGDPGISTTGEEATGTTNHLKPVWPTSTGGDKPETTGWVGGSGSTGTSTSGGDTDAQPPVKPQ